MALRPAVLVAVAAALGLAAAPAQASQPTHGPDPVPPATPLAAASAAGAGSEWCANKTPGAYQLENGAYRYRAVYVHPADRPSRLEAIGGALQIAAFDASELLEREYRRAIRFDVGTPCGRGQLDVAEVRLPLTEAELAALAGAGGTATFDAVAGALREAGFSVAANDATPEQIASLTENYLVWLDAPAPARSCGQGTALLDSTRSASNLNNFGGKLALIFRHGGAFCGADVVRHEIAHNLGALQPDAPNTTDGVHCDDAFEDTMCGLGAPKIVGGAFNGLYFDYGNDDYWDPPQGQPLGWWTLNLSRFICADTHCNRPATGRAKKRKAGRSSRAKRPRAKARRPRAGLFGKRQ